MHHAFSVSYITMQRVAKSVA